VDKLDAFIKRCATALHEAGRQRAVARRHRKEEEAAIRRNLTDLEDRIALHFPPTKRESRLDLTDAQFKKLQAAETAHRMQLFLTVVSMAGFGNDAPPESDLNF
jgi:hypothetical protein